MSMYEMNCWRTPDLLAKKSEGGIFSEQEIAFIVRSICDRNIDDCQLGALLMSVKLRGMTDGETIALTKAMRDSGTVMSWPIDWPVVDKHSTGGVGDKVSLALAPALAAMGVRVPMISGRGLAHTGGTLDKLESIPGFRASMSEREIYDCIGSVGCCIVGQTADIVPADRRMYSARDVTSTVPSMPLIVSSIISKKAAESLKALVLDVKFGRGAFMKTREEAEKLAQKMVDVGNGVGMRTTALLTTMDVPIGRTIGNALEVREALDCLRGQGPPDLHQLVTSLGGELLYNTGLVESPNDGVREIHEVLVNGAARTTFCKMLQKQGVPAVVAESLCGPTADYQMLPSAKYITPVPAHCTGLLVDVDSLKLAVLSLALGAGRKRVGDPVNHAVGIVLLKVVGERVREGEAWAQLHHDEPLPQGALQEIKQSANIQNTYTFQQVPLIAAKIM
ncbi:thymidine phosphorylase-like [Palaemon carinicauda]|uniref:thymidine phosphorylase-like n=1 Tax=Palaemon carinicauda TaxID=392227 RepID=UPI0035B5CCDD